MRRSRTALASLLALVLVAGCLGGTVPAARSDAGGTPGDDGSQWNRFAFTDGEYYQYRVTDYTNDESALISWEVLSIDANEVTAEVTYDDGDTTFSRTITGPKQTIVLQLSGSGGDQAEANAMRSVQSALLSGPFNPTMTGYYAHRDLVVGDSWNAAGSDEIGYATANVEGRDSYAGQECYVTSFRVPDDGEWPAEAEEYEFCISPDASLPFATLVYNDATDEVTVGIVLEEYRSG